MSGAAENVLSPRDVYLAVMRHKWKAIGIFVGTMALVVLALIYLPRTYHSEARLFVRLGRESVSLDPTATTGQTVSVNESREVEINSILEVLKSRAIAEQVVDAIGPEAVLGRGPGSETKPGATGWMGELKGRLRGALGNPSVTTRERATTAVAETLTIWAPKRTSVICMRYETASPQLAQQVVATALEVYLDEHVRVNRTQGSYEFFVEQARLLAEKVKLSQGRLRDAKNEIGLASIAGHRATLESEIKAIESQIINAQAELAASEAKAGALGQKVAELPERIVTQEVTGLPNQAADNMRDLLYQLEIRERELQSKYNDSHPLLVTIRDQLRQAQAIHAGQRSERTQSTSAVHPARLQLQFSLLTEQAMVSSLQSRVQALETERQLALERMKILNTDEIQIGELEREVNLAESSYWTYAEKLEQARIDQQLETERISNVNIVQPASFVAKASKPNRAMVLMLGLLMATTGGLGSALLAEYLRPSLKTPADVERSLDLPVLLEIPRLTQQRSLWN